MWTIAKRVLLWTVIVGATVLVAGFITSCTSKPFVNDGVKAYDIDRADVGVQLRRDASLIVTERLHFRYAGSFSGGYRDIALQPGVSVSDVSVTDENGAKYRPGGNTTLGSFDVPGVFGAVRTTDGIRVVWHYRQQDGDRTFALRYRVRGATKVAADGVVVPWAFWGEQWNFRLHELTAHVEASTAAQTPLWVVPGRNDLGIETSSSRDGAEVSATTIPSHTMVAATVAFPRSAITSTRGAAKRRVQLGAARAEAEAAAKDASSPLVAAATAVAGHQYWLIGGVALLTLGALASMLWLAREPRIEVPKYLPEPPDDATPAVGYALAREGGYTDRLVPATLLDLVNRGLYRAEPLPAGDLELMLSVPQRSPGAVEALEPYEQDVVAFFDGLLKTPGRLDELKDRVPKHSASWRSKWAKMTTNLDKAEVGEIIWDRTYTAARGLLVATVIAVLVALGLCTLYRTGVIFAPVVALAALVTLLVLIPSTALKRRDPASTMRGRQWAAFERWTRDFPRLHDDPPATLALWKRILVFGVAFGTAEAVVKSGRIPASVFAEAPDGDWTAPLATGAMYGSFSHADRFGSSFSSHVASESSSSGGGGGGGGGGFSGGGGGGAW